MRPSKLQRVGKGSRGNLRGIEGTYNINIYRLKVPLVPLVPSNIFSFYEETLERGLCCIPQIIFNKVDLLCFNEGTKGTKGTGYRRIAILGAPFTPKQREPEASLEGTL